MQPNQETVSFMSILTSVLNINMFFSWRHSVGLETTPFWLRRVKTRLVLLIRLSSTQGLSSSLSLAIERHFAATCVISASSFDKAFDWAPNIASLRWSKTNETCKKKNSISVIRYYFQILASRKLSKLCPKRGKLNIHLDSFNLFRGSFCFLSITELSKLRRNTRNWFEKMRKNNKSN